ncbi:uncharacterized protein LOC110379533 [Helicoverpa armigera]|uniref:MICOS complex subunit MIC13 n=1 Tax=Helicoverpa armigera TaxID=29058 RepID=A0A2W1BLP8_HELAM|nr:uncharacterized protein LOC110379533 [Helicoverpa armigera]PZC74554.1 hypothetical protein B5X24_HaOG207688 [Helicoverpa armigera]
MCAEPRCGIKTERVRCDVCRTINLAKHLKHPKPDMQMYEKCAPREKFCPQPDIPLHPTCIKVCSRHEYKMKKSGQTVAIPRMPYYVHGKLLYAIKAGIIVGSLYFTYTQGVWGDQREVTECLRRWSEYLRSINTRRPPVFDQCGNVIKKDTVETMAGPLYSIYKSAVTTCFAGVVKVPLLIKCAYFDYLKAMEKKKMEEEMERKLKKK